MMTEILLSASTRGANSEPLKASRLYLDMDTQRLPVDGRLNSSHRYFVANNATAGGPPHLH